MDGVRPDLAAARSERDAAQAQVAALTAKNKQASKWLMERAAEIESLTARLLKAEEPRPCAHLEHTPEGTRLAYLTGGTVRLLGYPADGAEHDCDAMGCGTFSHVLEIYEIAALAGTAPPAVSPEAPKDCDHPNRVSMGEGREWCHICGAAFYAGDWTLSLRHEAHASTEAALARVMEALRLASAALAHYSTGEDPVNAAVALRVVDAVLADSSKAAVEAQARAVARCGGAS